jgi:hypothetical protein
MVEVRRRKRMRRRRGRGRVDDGALDYYDGALAMGMWVRKHLSAHIDDLGIDYVEVGSVCLSTQACTYSTRYHTAVPDHAYASCMHPLY